jgi:hypothetical protein
MDATCKNPACPDNIPIIMHTGESPLMNAAPEPRLSIVGIIMRSLAVGFAYALASALAASILGPLSRLSPSIDNLLVWLISGTLTALALAPFILHSISSRRQTIFAAWAVIAFVRAFGLGIEGSLFKPTQAVNAMVGAAVGLLIAWLVAWLSVRLLMPSRSQTARAASGRSLWGWTWRVIVVGLAYFAFYFIFGAANALLYTKSFYENNAQYGLTLPPAGVIFAAQLLRGPLFGLGSLFIVLAAEAPRRRMAVWLGLLLFVVGGLGPYIETTFRTMPLGFNLATLLEIFLQNFLTGVVAVYLYKSKKASA